jgi:WD40 repeat protein
VGDVSDSSGAGGSDAMGAGGAGTSDATGAGGADASSDAPDARADGGDASPDRDAGSDGGAPAAFCGGPLGWGSSPFAVLSPDGALVAIASPPGLVSVSRWSDGTPVAVSSGALGARATAFSGDGTLLVASGEDALKVWRVSDGALVHAEPALARAVSVGVSKDGSVIAASGFLDVANTARVWRAADPSNVRSLTPTQGGVGLTGIAVSPDGSTVYSGYVRVPGPALYEDWLVAWHTSDGTPVFDRDEQAGFWAPPLGLVLDPAGGSLVSGLSTQGFSPENRLWNAATGASIGLLGGMPVTFSPDGSAVLTMVNLQAGLIPAYTQLDLYRASDQVLARSVMALAGDQILGAGFGPALAVRSVERTTESFLFVENQTKLRSIPATSTTGAPSAVPLDDVASSSDGRWVATLGQSGGGIRVWDTTTRAVVRSFAGGGPLAMSADGTRVYYASQSGLHAEQGFDVDPGAGVYALDLAPAGDLLAVGKGDNTAELRRTTDGSVTHLLWDITNGHTGPVSAVGFAKDGSLVATGSQDKTVRIWNVSDGQFVRAIAVGTPVTSVVFDSDKSWLLVGDTSNTLTRFKVSDGTSLGAHAVGVTARPKLTPDDGTVYLPGPGSVIAFRVSDWASLPALLGHAGVVERLALSADGKRLVSVSDDGTARVYCLP